jgi:hypothetical protein
MFLNFLICYEICTEQICRIPAKAKKKHMTFIGYLLKNQVISFNFHLFFILALSYEYYYSSFKVRKMRFSEIEILYVKQLINAKTGIPKSTLFDYVRLSSTGGKNCWDI